MTNTDRSLQLRPDGSSLNNWRLAPYSQWAFQNLRELIPSALISVKKTASPLPLDHSDIPGALKFACAGGAALDTVLTESETDCMVILHRGKIVWRWSAAHCNVARPHVVFSTGTVPHPTGSGPICPHPPPNGSFPGAHGELLCKK